MDPIRIHLFGGFLLERGATTLPPIASRAGRSLFARLVMQRGRPMQRGQLAEQFWPDLPEGRARRRLSHTLWQIQDVVNDGPASPLTVGTDTLAFDTDVPYWLDVEAFDTAYGSLGLDRKEPRPAGLEDLASLRRCVELYRGDFLAGFFDDWVVVEQEVYRERYRVALGRLVEVSKAHGAYEEALTHARRLTHHDPLREEAHREVMRLCFLLDRVNDAVQQYERCKSVLEEALGAEPSRPTVELYRRIVEHRRGAIPIRGAERSELLGGRTDVPFVGRVEERRRLVDLFESVLGGRGGVALVEGEPGVGKTRLALEATDDARWRGFEVAWGSCREGTLRPFAPIAEVFGTLSPLRAEQLAASVRTPWLEGVARLAPRLASLAAGDGPADDADAAEMQDALATSLVALGRIAPHLVVIDDVHWADRDTLAVLRRLGPRLASGRVLLLLLFRSEEGRGDPEVWDTLRDLDRTAGIGREVLSPMSVFELGQLVQRTLGLSAVEPDVVSGLHRRTGGNALFTVETLLSAWEGPGAERPEDPDHAVRRLVEDPLPVADRVRSVVEARIARLGDEAASVLETSAIVGDAVDIGVLAHGAALDRFAALAAVDDLLRRRLLTEEGGRYRIAHDHIRQLVAERMDQGGRRALHHRIAEALVERTPHDVEALAYHFSRAGTAAPAARFHRDAGLRARRLGAIETAAQHFDASARWAAAADLPAGERYEILGLLEGVLGVLGRRDEQRTTIDTMAGLAPADESGDLDRRRAWLFAHTGRFEAAEEHARRAVRAEEGRDGTPGLAESLVALGTCVRWSGRPLEAIPHLRAALDAAGDDVRERAEALTELGSTLVEVQQSSEALVRLDEAEALFRSLGDPRGEAEVLGIGARAHRQLGATDRAAELYDRALALCRRIGYRHGEGVNLVNLGTLHYLQGRPGDALAAYDDAAVVFGEIGDRRGEAMVLANAASVRHTLLGDDERALRDAEAALARFSEIGDRARQAQCLEVLAGVARRRGEGAEALQLLERSLDLLAGTGNRYLEAQHLRSLALLHLHTGAPLRALEAMDHADRVCEQAGLADLAVELDSIRAWALLQTGSADEALAVVRRAAERLTPGVESAYMVHHRHAVVADACGLPSEASGAAAAAMNLLEAALAGLPPAAREIALGRVPDHRRIVETWRRLSPTVLRVRLASARASTGRPLTDDDRIEVSWTVEHPDDAGEPDRVARRRRRLLRLLDEARRQGAAPSIDDLSGALGVSPSTVGRDLAALRDEGHAVRTRGDQAS